MAVVNPRQVRFARPPADSPRRTPSTPRSWPTSPRWSVQPSAPAGREEPELSAVLARRRQIVEMLTAERNRREGSARAVRRGILSHIKWLERNLKETDGDLSRMIRESPLWREKDDLLKSAPGVGTRCEHHPPGQPARIGESQPQADRGLGWEWLPSTATAAPCGASARFGADGPKYGPRSTWRPWPRHDTTL